MSRVFQQWRPCAGSQMWWCEGSLDKSGSWPARLVPRKTSAPRRRWRAARFHLLLPLLRSAVQARGRLRRGRRTGSGGRQLAAVCMLEVGLLSSPLLKFPATLQGERAAQQGEEAWEGLWGLCSGWEQVEWGTYAWGSFVEDGCLVAALGTDWEESSSKGGPSAILSSADWSPGQRFGCRQSPEFPSSSAEDAWPGPSLRPVASPLQWGLPGLGRGAVDISCKAPGPPLSCRPLRQPARGSGSGTPSRTGPWWAAARRARSCWGGDGIQRGTRGGKWAVSKVRHKLELHFQGLYSNPKMVYKSQVYV